MPGNWKNKNFVQAISRFQLGKLYYYYKYVYYKKNWSIFVKTVETGVDPVY